MPFHLHTLPFSLSLLSLPPGLPVSKRPTSPILETDIILSLSTVFCVLCWKGASFPKACFAGIPQTPFKFHLQLTKAKQKQKQKKYSHRYVLTIQEAVCFYRGSIWYNYWHQASYPFKIHPLKTKLKNQKILEDKNVGYLRNVWPRKQSLFHHQEEWLAVLIGSSQPFSPRLSSKLLYSLPPLSSKLFDWQAMLIFCLVIPPLYLLNFCKISCLFPKYFLHLGFPVADLWLPPPIQILPPPPPFLNIYCILRVWMFACMYSCMSVSLEF